MSLLLCSRVGRTLSRRVEEEGKCGGSEPLSLPSTSHIWPRLWLWTVQSDHSKVRCPSNNRWLCFYGYSILLRQITTCSISLLSSVVQVDRNIRDSLVGVRIWIQAPWPPKLVYFRIPGKIDGTFLSKTQAAPSALLLYGGRSIL